jgi:hypothetical protein
MKLVFPLLALLLLAPGFAHAQDEESAMEDVGPADEDPNKPKVVYRKRSTVSFEDRVVEGSGTNPEGVYIVTPPAKQFGSLLKLRPNFHRELMRDSLLLK